MGDDNTREIAEQIFSKQPGDAKSIDLELDESTVEFIQDKNELHDYIRDIISMITLHGIEILYGHRDLMSLTDSQLFMIKRYTRSYGFELNIKIEESSIMIAFEKMY